MVGNMSPRHQPRTPHRGSSGNRPGNPPIGPTGPSPDHVRRLNSERHHPALYIGKTPRPAPSPDRGPGVHPGRFRADRHRHPVGAQRPLPRVVHDPEHEPHATKFADFDAGTDAAMRVTSPIRPPMRLTRDGRTKSRDFGRRH